jgi:hypothetical protein
VPGKRLPPEKDNILVAWLHGAANRHAGPECEAREAAVAELRGLATDPQGRLRSDLLAQVAGICRGYELQEDPSAVQYGLMVGLLIDSGADPDLIDHWVAVGRDRASRAAKAMRGH